MHPHSYYSDLYSPKKREEVFVIMGFNEDGERAWAEIVEPTIRDVKLKPVRVDFRTGGDSIMHDIMDGIAHSRLVVADITSSSMTDLAGEPWPQRNANVLWELGIAHTMRLPDEVVVIKFDNDRSIFDLTQFRVFQFDRSQVTLSRLNLEKVLRDRLRSIDQTKSEHVIRTITALTGPCIMAFFAWSELYSGELFQVRITAATELTMHRFIELGIIEVDSTRFTRPDPEQEKRVVEIYYRVTEFGRAVISHVLSQHGLTFEEVRETAARAKKSKLSSLSETQ